MTQPDLFASFTRTGSSIVPPTPDELARRRRDTGIGRSADHAHRVDPLWQERAVRVVALYARYHEHFQAEDVRDVAETTSMPLPPDGRAWGAVMKRAAKEGIVKADGYAPSNSSNKSPKVRWMSLVFA